MRRTRPSAASPQPRHLTPRAPQVSVAFHPSSPRQQPVSRFAINDAADTREDLLFEQKLHPEVGEQVAHKKKVAKPNQYPKEGMSSGAARVTSQGSIFLGILILSCPPIRKCAAHDIDKTRTKTGKRRWAKDLKSSRSPPRKTFSMVPTVAKTSTLVLALLLFLQLILLVD